MLPEAICEGVPLARFTTMQVGGPARYFAQVSAGGEAARLAGWAADVGLPWVVLGHGSNVIFPDSGYDGLVIVYRSPRPDLSAGAAEPTLVLEAGVPLAVVARWTAEQGLSGLEWASGLPGTLGGAVAGNAGAFAGSMADVVESVEVTWPGGPVQTVCGAELGFAYRHCSLLAERGPALVTSVRLKLERSDRESCLARLSEVEQKRRATQPVGASSGCIFRNPPGQSAGYLLDCCGLKGVAVGGAVVSERHANFIINRGQATAADVLALIRLARQRVWERFGIRLEPEVRLLGGARMEVD